MNPYAQKQPVCLMRCALISIDTTLGLMMCNARPKHAIHFSCVFVLRALNFFILSNFALFLSVRFEFVSIKDLIVQRHLKVKMYVCMKCAWVYLLHLTQTRLLIQRAAAKSTSATSTEKVSYRWNDWLVFHNIYLTHLNSNINNSNKKSCSFFSLKLTANSKQSI